MSQQSVLDSAMFRSAFRSHPAGVAVVTLNGPGGPVGFTATSVVSVSAEPPIILFTMIGTSSSFPAASQADTVVLHLLSTDHAEISQRFSTSGIDRFEGLDWSPLETGEPLISGVDTWLRCSVLRHDVAGGSHIFQVQPIEGTVAEEREPLVYHNRQYHRLSEASVI